MGRALKFSAVASVFDSCADRFVQTGYSRKKSFKELLEAAKKVPDLTGVELVGGWHLKDGNAREVIKMVENYGLKVAIILPELWSSAKWGRGSFTSNDEKIRREAIDQVKRSMDLAKEINCNLVNLWFGQDGYDYCFQADYIKAWDRIIDGLIECADYLPDVKIAIEYKIKEPRTHCYVGTVGKVALLTYQVNRLNVGVTLDVGHALEAYENMAESVALLKRFGDKLFHLHLNDNYRLWDDDMIPSAVHLIEFLELLYWLDRIEYNGWYSVDIFPYREDGTKAVIESIEWIKGLFRVLDKMNKDEIERIIQKGDATESSEILRKGLFSL
ncbi:sugar phosphate isomerase/epimerase [Candidatus Aerophobetes bacterium]|nr:sugar phosphate isomerase/epimerase [Candidatus Aerophobetes bacterium]